jgi:hypothetical protein
VLQADFGVVCMMHSFIANPQCLRLMHAACTITPGKHRPISKNPLGTVLPHHALSDSPHGQTSASRYQAHHS